MKLCKSMFVVLAFLCITSVWAYPAWQNNLTYQQGDIVTHNGSDWQAVRFVYQNTPPSAGDTWFWKAYIAEGPDKSQPISTGEQWKLVSADVKNARDIAAYNWVYALSSDGTGLYFCPSTENPAMISVPISGNPLVNDPGVEIVAGPQTTQSNGVINRGLYIRTEGEKVYNLKFYRGSWFLSNPISSNSVAIAINNNGYFYDYRKDGACYEFVPVRDSETGAISYGAPNQHTVHLFDAAQVNTGEVEGDIIAITNKTSLIPGGPEGTLFALTTANKIYVAEEYTPLTRGGGHGGDYPIVWKPFNGVPSIIPTKDIEQMPTLGSPGLFGYATYDNGSNEVHYYDNCKTYQWIDLGECGKVSIGKDAHLYDASSVGVYRVKLPYITDHN